MACRHISSEFLVRSSSVKMTARRWTSHVYGTAIEQPSCVVVINVHVRTGIAAGSTIPIALMRKLIEKLNLTELTIAYGMSASSSIQPPVCIYSTLR